MSEVLVRGKYRITREIARSNDVVYEAVDVTLGRKVALKELNLPPTITGHLRRERVERFNREARAAGRLGHPNIVSIFDVGEDNGRHFIAMEFLDGQNLRDILQVRSPLPVSEAVDICCQVLEALSCAHANGVVHRDIKPDNIQRLSSGVVKLTDFGIARLEEEPALTSNGQVFGTPSYMSPEQIEGKAVDHRTDIFSLGVVLYEVLTGRKPFIGDSVIGITYAIMHAEPPPMTGVSPYVEQIVRRALSKSPLSRPATAAQMSADLRAAGQGSGAIQAGFPPSGILAGPGPAPGSGPLQPAAQGLPWSWNGQTQPPSSGHTPVPAGAGSLTGLQGQPFAPPGVMMRPPRTLPSLSPETRRFFASVVAAILIGALIAIGIIMFTRSYDRYRTTAGAQVVSLAMQEGSDAYNRRDYTAAVAAFERAERLNPTGAERVKTVHNLEAAYVQLARQNRAAGKLEDARAIYLKALELSPDDAVAHADLAQLLDQMGQTQDAARERNAATSAPVPADPAASLRIDTLPPEASGPGTQAPQFMVSQRQQAAGLIEEGKQRYRAGDTDGARTKWRDAVGRAPGTPERDEAQALLDQTQTPANFDGG